MTTNSAPQQPSWLQRRLNNGETWRQALGQVMEIGATPGAVLVALLPLSYILNAHYTVEDLTRIAPVFGLDQAGLGYLATYAFATGVLATLGLVGTALGTIVHGGLHIGGRLLQGNVPRPVTGMGVSRTMTLIVLAFFTVAWSEYWLEIAQALLQITN